MANLKISELPTATPLSGAELVEVVQGGINKKVTASDLGGGVSDGNKGDITVSGSGATWEINDGVALGGNPTATTQGNGDNSTRIATTAFVQTVAGTVLGAQKLYEFNNFI